MTTLEPSQPTLFDETELPLTSSAEGSRARTFLSLEKALASKVRDLVCGESMHGSLANYDLLSSSWKTSQHCLVEGLAEFSATWPRSGTTRRGIAYQLVPSAPLTGEIASGSWPTPHGFSQDGRSNGPSGNELGRAVNQSLWPTPTSSLGTQGGRVTPRKSREGGTLIEAASNRTFATPTSRDWRSGKASAATHARNSRPLSEQIGGSLNPTWVEGLMGFPLGWCAVSDKG